MSNCIQIDSHLCIGCGLCVKDCPCHAIKLENGKAVMFMDRCLECGHCLAICPQAAVAMRGYDAQEILEYDAEKFEIPAENFLNSVKFRRSVRCFKAQDVEREKLLQIIEAGRFTPTGTNKQRIRYIVVEHPERSIEPDAIHALNKAKSIADTIGKVVKLPYDTKSMHIGKGFFFHGAPVVILVVADDTVDASLASANMGTMAERLGLGLFYVGFFAVAAKLSRALRKRLHLTGREKVVTAIALGYPDVTYRRTVPRKKPEITWM